MYAILRGIAGFVIGYFAVVLLTTGGFDVWLGRQPSPEDGLVLVAAGALVTVVAGGAGGALGAWISGRVMVGAAIAVPLIAESIWLLFFRNRTAPATWYDMAGAVILIGSTVAGAVLIGWCRRSHRRQPSSAPSSGTAVNAKH